MQRPLARGGAGALVPAGLRGYGDGSLRQDLFAGVTAAAVVVPIAMAHATIAGLLAMLAAGEEKLAQKGGMLWLAGLNPHVLEIVREAPLGRKLGRERMFFNVQTAVEAYEQRFGQRASGASPSPIEEAAAV